MLTVEQLILFWWGNGEEEQSNGTVKTQISLLWKFKCFQVTRLIKSSK